MNAEEYEDESDEAKLERIERELKALRFRAWLWWFKRRNKLMSFDERNNRIRNQYLEGVPVERIADEYGLTGARIYNITRDLPRRERTPQGKRDCDYSFGVYPTLFQFRRAYGLSFNEAVRKIVRELTEEQPDA